MTNNALYFPYIDVPKTQFITTSFLYWDKLYTIAPHGSDCVLAETNENKKLIDIGALEQIHPEDYTHKYNDFSSRFIRVIDRLDLQKSYKNDGGWASLARIGSRIHSAKLIGYNLENELIERNLVRRGNDIWLDMEPRTALYLMLYLSACLSEDDALKCRPISDIVFSENGDARINVDEIEMPTNDPRYAILHKLLPTFDRPVPASELARVRNKYHSERVEFRRDIDNFIENRLTSCRTADERDFLIKNYIHEKSEQISEIRRQLHDFKPLANVGFATLGFASATYAAISGLDASSKLGIAAAGAAIAYAARAAVKDWTDGTPDLKKPIAYAALLQHRFS